MTIAVIVLMVTFRFSFPIPTVVVNSVKLQTYVALTSSIDKINILPHLGEHTRLFYHNSGAPNENMAQNHLNMALLNVF